MNVRAAIKAGFLTAIVLILTACAPVAAPTSKLIEWGWDTPRLQAFASVLPAAQSLPFDGAVIDIATPLDKRGLSWTLFGDTPTDEQTLSQLATDYAKLSWGPLTNNFLRLTVFPANVDWFDDWAIIQTNATAWARFAHDLGFAGIMLDTEQYGKSHLFEYALQSRSSNRSFSDYAKQAVTRGKGFMDALERGFPGLTVMFTYALTIDSGITLADPKTSRYGLLVPFVEGMAAAADSDSTLVDGFEHSYIYKDPSDFEQAANRIRAVRPHYIDGTAWRAPGVGFGLWIDPVCGSGGLPDAGCGFSRVEFTIALAAALHNSDRYVWIYSQHINWYTGEHIPAAWTTLMRDVRSASN